MLVNCHYYFCLFPNVVSTYYAQVTDRYFECLESGVYISKGNKGNINRDSTKHNKLSDYAVNRKAKLVSLGVGSGF